MPIVLPSPTPTVTVSTLINAAMRKIGVLASGESADGESLTDAFNTLNRLIEGWWTEGLTAYATTEISQATTTAQTTIGAGATINETRPVQIESAFWDDNDVIYELEIVTHEEFKKLSHVSSTGTPEILYYDSSYPFGTINLYPTPTSGTLKLLVRSQFDRFAATGSAVVLPPGYERALVNALAVEIAPDFGMDASPTLVSIARDSKADIQRLNNRLKSVMDLPSGYAVFSNSKADIFRG